MRYVVSFSGGVCSWFAARRTVDKYGPTNVTLLFADTKMEDEDLYRFLGDAEKDLGVPVTKVADGRNPWQVFFDNRFMGNSQVDLCSRILKRELIDKWHASHCDPADTTIVIGLGPGEDNRLERFRAIMNAKGWQVVAPAMDPPHLTKDEMIQALLDRGIAPPALYEEGFPHNNCGGFCVKMGIKQARHLLLKRPETYAYHEYMEQRFRDFIGKDVAVLRDRRGGKVRPLTLKELRESTEKGEWLPGDWGGCGCAID